MNILYVVTASSSANILLGQGENINVPYPGGQLMQITNWCTRGASPPPKPAISSGTSASSGACVSCGASASSCSKCT